MGRTTIFRAAAVIAAGLSGTVPAGAAELRHASGLVIPVPAGFTCTVQPGGFSCIDGATTRTPRRIGVTLSPTDPLAQEGTPAMPEGAVRSRETTEGEGPGGTEYRLTLVRRLAAGFVVVVADHQSEWSPDFEGAREIAYGATLGPR